MISKNRGQPFSFKKPLETRKTQMPKNPSTRRPKLRIVEPTPTAPPSLTPATQAWVDAVVEEFEFSASDMQLLLLAAKTLDEIEECNSLIAAQGLIIPGREGGMRAHPAATILRHARGDFGRMLRQLDLEPPKDLSHAHFIKGHRR
jgi:hypothetical protein